MYLQVAPKLQHIHVHTQRDRERRDIHIRIQHTLLYSKATGAVSQKVNMCREYINSFKMVDNFREVIHHAVMWERRDYVERHRSGDKDGRRKIKRMLTLSDQMTLCVCVCAFFFHYSYSRKYKFIYHFEGIRFSNWYITMSLRNIVVRYSMLMRRECY